MAIVIRTIVATGLNSKGHGYSAEFSYVWGTQTDKVLRCQAKNRVCKILDTHCTVIKLACAHPIGSVRYSTLLDKSGIERT